MVILILLTIIVILFAIIIAHFVVECRQRRKLYHGRQRLGAFPTEDDDDEYEDTERQQLNT